MKPADQPDDLSAVELLHDLQTLLARIRLSTDLLNSQDQELLRAIHQDITTCQSLIFQQFSPTEGAIERLASTDLNELIQEEIIVLQRGQQTVLEQDLCEGTLWVKVQRLAIQRVLTNLLMNAHHYGKGWVRISTGRSLESAWFQIEDDGPGIQADQHTHLFQPWIRGLETPTRHQRGVSNDLGLGLGLSIVKKIIDSHQGRLHLGRNTRNGLAIKVVLPLKQPS